jgi:hypothetical protein
MDLQAKLNRGQWDNGTVNDVIDSLRKSANDDRLSSRDRQVLADQGAGLLVWKNGRIMTFADRRCTPARASALAVRTKWRQHIQIDQRVAGAKEKSRINAEKC